VAKDERRRGEWMRGSERDDSSSDEAREKGRKSGSSITVVTASLEEKDSEELENRAEQR
jgi:hypothetical protein